MRTRILFFLVLISLTTNAQHYGNVAYENNDRQGYQKDYLRVYNQLGTGNYLLNDSTYLLGANIMINVQPDVFIAVYSVQQEALTVSECNKLINSRIEKFLGSINKIGIKSDETFIDMIAQNRIYDYDISGNTATESKKGFEIKKNVVIRFTDNNLLDKINVLAAEQEIFDLVKVDYIILDVEKVQNQLRDEALKIVNSKKKFVSSNSDLDLKEKGRIQFEHFATIYPQESYKKYTAAESGKAQPSYYRNSDAWVKEQRKSQTFYFEKIHPGGFDKVINPSVVNVPVQMTLVIGYRYEI